MKNELSKKHKRFKSRHYKKTSRKSFNTKFTRESKYEKSQHTKC